LGVRLVGHRPLLLDGDHLPAPGRLPADRRPGPAHPATIARSRVSPGNDQPWATSSGGRRPDASMTLLTEVMERPLDPAYAAAAADPRHRGRVSLAITLVLAVVAGFVLCVAVRQIQQPRRESSAA